MQFAVQRRAKIEVKVEVERRIQSPTQLRIRSATQRVIP